MANEKRLIYANALMDAFRSYMVERYDKEKCVSEENCKTCENSCLWRKIVSAAPTVDAVEVVHGRFTNVQGLGDGTCVGFCSNCMTPHKANNLTALRIDYRHCRWCGAKMDGDGNG